MEILYISSNPSREQFDYMQKMLRPNKGLAKYGMQESGYKFHSLIIKGLAYDKKNNILSLVGRPTSFKVHKGLIWRKNVSNNNNVKYFHIGFINLPILKKLIISVSYFFLTLKWLRKNRKTKEKLIIMDAAYVSAIPFVILASKCCKCTKISIVCDIYEYMADVEDAREKKIRIHKFINKLMKRVYRKIDGFIFLTKEMSDVINFNNKPYIVMEGLVDSNMVTIDNIFEEKEPKDIIMYAGAIRAQYGLKNLVDGFHEYINKNAELRIYGAGDFVPEIERYTKKDNRIKFCGILPNSEIIKKEIAATLLVNPRNIDQEFTKYSFPSKNMEYMVSGTPILTTKLPGMPKDYYNYIYTIDGNTKNDIKKALEKTLSISKLELHKKGSSAKKFVLENKNNLAQAKRILDFGKELIKNETN